MPAAKMKSINFDTLDRGTRFVKLVTPIDEHEIAALAVEAAQAAKSIEQLDEEKKTLNADLRDLRDKRDEALKAVGTGQREKDVQCEIGYDWKSGRKYIKRLDTQELVNADGEPIPDEERQMQLEGMDAASILKRQVEEDQEASFEDDGDDQDDDETPEDDLDKAMRET